MKKIRFLSALIAILIMSALLSGCAKTSSQIESEKQEEIKAANIADVQKYTEEYFAQAMKTATLEQFTAFVDGGETVVSKTFDNDWGNRWQQFIDEHGQVKDAVVDLTQRTAEGGYTSRIILTGEDGEQMALTVTYDEAMIPLSTAISPYSNDAEETLGSKMSTAAGNTITGLLVVFFILIGLSLIISCFKFVNKAAGEVAPQNKDAKKAAPAKAAAAPAKAVPAVSAPEDDLMKNQELVAVISAAVAAYAAEEAGNVPVDGYVVRSIKRLHNNKWH